MQSNYQRLMERQEANRSCHRHRTDSSKRLPAFDDAEQNHNNGDDEQNVNQAMHRVRGNHPQQPEQKKNYRNRV